MKWLTVAVASVMAIGLTGCIQAAPSIAATPAAVFPATSGPTALGKLRDVTAPTDQGSQLLDTRLSRYKAVICEYGSVFNQGSGPRHTLVKQANLTAAQAKRLATATARIDVGTSTGSVSCPNDSGSVTVIAFAYRNAPPVDLWQQTTGCQTIHNGATQAGQIANTSFGDLQTVFAHTMRAAATTTTN